MSGEFPTLIIGMHRSGTTILSKCLEAGGWFGGWRKENNNESTFYLRLNEWILQNFCIDWESPKSIDEHIDSIFNVIEPYVRRVENSFLFYEYIGFKKNQQKKWHWGFKDPRSSLTIPFWSRYYGKTKIVHIRRDGIDVAKSLISRKNKYQERVNPSLPKVIKKILFKEKVFPNMKPFDINHAIDLWYEYEIVCQNYSSDCQILSLTYENLIEIPDVILNQIFDFMEIDIKKSKIDKIVLNIDKNKNKEKKDKYFEQLTDKSIQKLSGLGYGP